MLKRAKVLDVSGAQGKVTYSKYSGENAIKVSKKGNITVGKNVEPGTYGIRIAVSAAGDDFYKAKTVYKTVNITVKKVNPITVVPRTATVTAGKKVVLAKSKVLTVLRAKGKVTFTKEKGNAKIKIAKKTGKVTVKKGLKKGKTYKVKVAVKAAGNNAYAAKTVKKTFAIRVSTQ